MEIIKKEIVNRILSETEYILNTKNTVRDAAKKFKVSKSTVHKDLHERLFYIDYELYKKIKKIMKDHIETRHIKGGESTRLKYISLKNAR